MTYPQHGEGSDVQGQPDNNGGTDSAASVEAMLNAADATGQLDDTGPAQQQTQPQQQTVEGAGGSQQSEAPYAQYLKSLPPGMAPVVEPIFKKWDADVTQRFQGLHSEVEPYRPLIDGYESDYLQQGVQLLEALESDPQRFMQALQASYGVGTEQGTTDQQVAQQQQLQEPNAGQFGEPEYQDDPRLAPIMQQMQQQEQLLRVMAEREIARQEAQEFEANKKLLDDTLSTLHKDHGEFDDQYVINLLGQGLTPEDALKQFNNALQQFTQRVTAPNADAPTVVGSGGGYPTQQVDTTNMTAQQRKDLMVQMLAADG